MNTLQIKPNIFWTGVIDWNLRHFHGYTFSTKRGSTYNSYLIIDDKITLVDTVLGSFSDEMIDKIQAIVPLEKIDYLIVNHIEPDHSGALPEIIAKMPKVKLFGTAKCQEGLYRHYYQNWNFQIVKTGDEINLGKRTLKFLEAPMIHWPDSMFTYCPQEKLLLPNDAFGQHLASNERFTDELDQNILMEEFAKYYANIIWPFSPLVTNKLAEIEKLGWQIDMIAPSHGLIWRKDLKPVIDKYKFWGNNENQEKAVIVYETMWGSTKMMAEKIKEGLIDAGIPVQLFDVTQTDKTDIITAMLEAKYYFLGSSTHDNGVLPTFASFLEFFKGLRPKKRQAYIFGSYGWAGGAAKEIEEALKQTEVTLAAPPLTCKYVPSTEELKQCYEMGKNISVKN